jgi:CheY-like chemotaxis protein
VPRSSGAWRLTGFVLRKDAAAEAGSARRPCGVCGHGSATGCAPLVITHILFLHPRETQCDRLIAPLAAAGYRVGRDDGSGTPQALLTRIAASRPDLLMLDFVLLDEVRRWQLLHRLRMHQSTRALPVIVCAGRVPLVQELRPHLSRIGVLVVPTTETGEELLTTIQEIQRRWHPSVPDDGASAPSHEGLPD